MWIIPVVLSCQREIFSSATVASLTHPLISHPWQIMNVWNAVWKSTMRIEVNFTNIHAIETGFFQRRKDGSHKVKLINNLILMLLFVLEIFDVNIITMTSLIRHRKNAPINLRWPRLSHNVSSSLCCTGKPVAHIIALFNYYFLLSFLAFW